MPVPQPLSVLRAIVLAAALVLTAPTPVAVAQLTQGKLISLDAEDAYLPSVLKILAEKGGLNIITGPGVTGGRISIHMRNVPVEQAVNLVVRAAGLAYERIGNSVLVADAKSLQEETGLSSYVVELKYADALEVKNALKGLTDQIEVDRGGNRLIVVTSPRVIAEIEDVVRVMDVPVQQVMLEARIVEVSTDAAKELGIDWNLLNRQGIILVEGPNPGSSPAGLPPGDLPYIDPSPGTRDWYKLRAVTRQAKTFQVALDMMIEDGNARVLANPKIATLNGRQASMLIGSRIPFTVTGVVSGGGAGAGVATQKLVEREEVGIKLRITPTINPDGYITTVINPEVSSVTGFTGEFNDLPIVSTREASTTVRLKDGNSIIIGGLLSEEKSTTVTKLPLLGQIPIIGVLFQHHSVTMNKKELVIEVTPHIMQEQR